MQWAAALGVLLAMAGLVLVSTMAPVAMIDWLGESRVPRLLGPVARRLRRWRADRRPAPVEMPPVLFELELHRLGAHVTHVLESDLPAKAARVAAAQAAYDLVLLDYCRSVGLTRPGVRDLMPLSAQERFAAEEALVGAGYLV